MDGIKGLYLFLRGHYSPNEIARQLDAKEEEIWDILNQTPVFAEVESALQNKNLASWMEFHLYMQNQLLRDADVMSMTHGVEIRVPFLYDDHIQFCMSLDKSVKYPDGFPKQLLIEAFRDQLPEKVWNRPKMGFSFPFAEWLMNSPVVKAMNYSSKKHSLKNYQRFINGELHWSQLMTLLIMSNRNVN